MGWWFLPIGFWFIGIVVMIAGNYVGHKISEKKEHLHKKSKTTQVQDTDASIYFAMEGKILDMMPWVTVRLFYIIFGMLIFALGFVALSFVI